MLNFLAIAGFMVTSLWSSASYACGGGFGEGLNITPSQTIIIRQHGQEETYIFNPSFCGAAAEFGLILPIPNTLTSEPALEDKEIYTAFDRLTAPKIVYNEVCEDDANNAGTFTGEIDGGEDGFEANRGVNVINSGQVGIFDWSLLRADNTAAFTNWLDANQYPYDTNSVEQFGYYVGNSWYFIAFKVTAATERPAQGKTICGSFGPIRFAFTASTPVIPTRIASVGMGQNQYFTWRIHSLTAKPVTIKLPAFSQNLHYAGVITRTQLDQFAKVATVAVEGDHLTTLDVSFRGVEVKEDISFSESSGPSEYRKTTYRNRYVHCGGCSMVRDLRTSSTPLPLIIAIGLFVCCYLRKRQRR
jgi:hypothetical protein